MQPGRLILIVTFLIGPWLMNPLGLMEKRTNSFWDSDSYCVAAAAAKSLQSCPTLCDPIDGSLPGSPVPGTLQARTLGWVAISFSNAWKWKVKVKSLSRVRLLVTPWTAAYQVLLSMGFSRQECWSGCHCLLRSLCHWIKCSLLGNIGRLEILSIKSQLKKNL